MDALQAIESRKSVRNYLPSGVEEEKISALVNSANSAPKAGPFHITVVTNTEMLQMINDISHDRMRHSGSAFLMERASLPGYRPMYEAPLLMVFSASEDNPYSQANVSNAATTAVIAATALGLGSCYVVTPTLALNTDAGVSAKIGIPAGYKAMCCVLAGYAGEEAFATTKDPADNINYYK